MRAALTIVAMTFAVGEALAQQTPRPPAHEAYHSRYMVAGFFLRAGSVCESDGTELIGAAFKFLGSEEIKAVSKGFPKITETWMTEGANGFNSAVMQDGIKPACASALANLHQIQKTDERLRSSSPPAANSPNVQSTAQPVNRRVDKCKALRQKDSQTWSPQTQKEYRDDCWQRVEADNGAVFRIDLGLIQEVGSEATTSIYNDEGGSYNPENLTGWFFTCEGHFRTLLGNGGLSPTRYAPPRSLAAQMSDIVCTGAGMASRRH